MPVRKVSSRGGNIIGRFPSLKMQRMVAFESLIERDYLYILDYEQDVEWFEEQPLTIEYQHDEKSLHYTADFHLIEGGQDVLVECKPYTLVGKEENQLKFHAARAWCTRQGWEFRVVTDQEIRTGFRLENIKLLTRYVRHTVGPDIKGCIFALLHTRHSPLALDSIMQEIGSKEQTAVMAGVLHMAFHHEVFVPLDHAPISGQTPVSLCPFTIEEGAPWSLNVFRPESGSTGKRLPTKSEDCCQQARSKSRACPLGTQTSSNCLR